MQSTASVTRLSSTDDRRQFITLIIDLCRSRLKIRCGDGRAVVKFLSPKLRYDTRCYFNVRSKADMSQLNLTHGTNN